ncbi:response regulator, partial [Candidatus Pacearchaeota archaeon]|nr:response regulator [Candidatus Pacearchaeota archaeon]
MLIVDDDETNREVLEVIFDQDFILQQVESGEAALEILPKFMPDIILLDIM